MLYRLKEDVRELAPRAVVLLAGTNDIEEKAAPEVTVVVMDRGHCGGPPCGTAALLPWPLLAAPVPCVQMRGGL